MQLVVGCTYQSWGQVQYLYLYLSTYLSVIDVWKCQKYLYLCLTKKCMVGYLAGTFQVQFIKKCKCSELLEYIIITVTIFGTNYR